MEKVIRKTLPRNISMGMLVIISAVVYFLAGQLFKTHSHGLGSIQSIHVAYTLVSVAVLIMILILWEELLFPVNIKPVDDGFHFSNHRRKLKFQTLLYLIIPVIVVFLFINYEVNIVRFAIWAIIVVVFPVATKLLSGLKNYNDFLTVTSKEIKFKDNDHEGAYEVSLIQRMDLEKDETGSLRELILHLKSGSVITIHIHQMELDDFLSFMEDYIQNTYKALL